MRLAEPRLRASASLASRLVAMADEPDARVRFVVLGALGSLTTPDAAAARSRLLFAHLDDVWMQRAALSAGSDQAPALFDAVVRGGSGVLAQRIRSRAAFVRQLASVIGARQKAAEVGRVIDAVAAARRADTAWWRAAALDGLAQGAHGRRSARKMLQGARAALLTLHEDAAAEVRAGALGLLQLAGPGDDAAWRAAVQRATAVADQGLPARGRMRSGAPTPSRWLAMDHPERRVEWLMRFVSPHEPEVVQVAAVTALGRIDPGARPRPARASSIGRFLLSHWAEFTPGIRSHAGDVLISDAGARAAAGRRPVQGDGASRGASASGRSRIWCCTRIRRSARRRARCWRKIRGSGPTPCAATRPRSTSRAIRPAASRCSHARAPRVIGSATPPAAISVRTSPRCGIVRR